MKGITEDFMLFIVGLFIIILILATIFGRGIVSNFLGYLAEVEPYNLQENIRSVLTAASYTSGDFEARIPVNVKHIITITDEGFPAISIESDSLNNFGNVAPQPFLTDCDIVKTCTKVCKFIGDECRIIRTEDELGNPISEDNCCGELGCDTTGHCASTYGDCGNGILNDGEECDPGNDDEGISPSEVDCPDACTSNCKCPREYDVGDTCYDDSDCYRLLGCAARVEFDSIGGTLLIKKYFVGDRCKLKIEAV